MNANLEQGLKPFGQYQGGNIDSVSLINGNVSLHIPLVSYPQRGQLTLDFFIRYNNKSWSVEITKDSSGMERRFWKWIGVGVEVALNRELRLNHSYIQVQPLYDPLGRPVFVHFYNAISSDGASHQLEFLTGSSHMMSVDASGIRYELQTQVLIDRQGIRYSKTQIEDPNGNKITIGTTGWVDTLGRLIPGSTVSDNSYGINVKGLLPGVPTTNFSLCPTGTVVI